MEQTLETVIVYPNRHLRAQRKELNDMAQGTYISYRAVRVLAKAGMKFRFVKEIKNYVDITNIVTEKILKDEKNRQSRPRLKRKEADSYDPFARG